MSLIISIHTGEGIVMASDSRTTYNTQDKKALPDGKGIVITRNQGVHFTDTTNKIFLGNKRIGISACGDASINGKPLAGFIESFINTAITDKTEICDIPDLLLDHFCAFSPVPDIVFHVAGYSKKDDIIVQEVYRIVTYTKKAIKIDTSLQGAIWNGETEILSRLIQTVWFQHKEVEKETGKEIEKYEERNSWKFRPTGTCIPKLAGRAFRSDRDSYSG